jgi:hypothetical protein
MGQSLFPINFTNPCGDAVCCAYLQGPTQFHAMLIKALTHPKYCPSHYVAAVGSLKIHQPFLLSATIVTKRPN